MSQAESAKSPGHRAYLETRAGRIARLAARLDEAYPGPAAVTLEIGCGHGHYLAAYAAQHPAEICLGIDIAKRRIELACRKRDRRNLDNLRFLRAEAGECLAAWPDHLAIDRVFVLFPDPWPKNRHAKNRLLQPCLLDELARRARPGTALHFRTDHAANFAWGCAVLAAHPAWSLAAAPPWPFESPTYFQQLAGGYQSLSAVRVNDPAAAL